MVLLSLYQPNAAEDIPLALASTILTTHVLHRSLTLGSAVGLLVHPLLYPLAKRRQGAQALPTTTTKPPAAAPSPLTFKNYVTAPRLIFPTIAKTTYALTAVITLAMTVRMWGKEDIEWQDRAYRLCWNEGQNRIDKGSLAGIIAAVAVGGVNGLRGNALVGAGGLGGLVGVIGAVGWKKLMAKN